MKKEEKRKNTRNVNRLKVNLKLIITISATLIAIFYSAIKIFFIKENVEINNNIIWLIIFGVALSYFILLSIEEGILIDRIFKIVGKIHHDKYVGAWNIIIKYINNQGNNITRSGSCKFEDAISGLRIDGGNILNENDEVEVDDWNSNSVELLEYADHTKLIYTYFTYEGDSLNPTKIGLVILTRKTKNGSFSGTFRDYDVSNGKNLKEGTVTLFR
jgi:hypothetical protein